MLGGGSGGSSRVGRQLWIQRDGATANRADVIGVISDSRVGDLRDSNSYAVYIPSLQADSASYKSMVMKGRASSRAVADAIEPLGHEYVRTSPTLDALIDRELGQERLAAALAAFFGLVALLLTGVGLYGLMAYAVVQRTREVGIRIALGAQRTGVGSWRARAR